MKFLLDENLSPNQSIALQRAGLDAVSAYESELSGVPADVVRRFAIESDRVLVTLDADFGHLHRFARRDAWGHSY